MLYYKKPQNIHYRFNPETFTYLEVFLSTEQCRVMAITGEEMYNTAIGRMTEFQFQESDATTFDQVLAQALTRLGS